MNENPTPDALLQQRAFVSRLARSLVRDPGDADDLAQETWLVALRRPPRVAEASRAFLARVVRNLARNRAREANRRRAREARTARPEADAAPEAGFDVGLGAQEKLVAALRTLPESYRQVIYLRFFEDLGPRAIAARLDAPLDTIKARLRRGLAQLRADLDRRHGGDRSAWCALLVPLARPQRAAGLVVWATAIGVLAVSAAAIARWSAPPSGSDPLHGVASTPASTEIATVREHAGELQTQDREPVRRAQPIATASSVPAGVPRSLPLTVHVTSWNPSITGPFCVGYRTTATGQYMQGTYFNGDGRHADVAGLRGAPGTYDIALFSTDDLSARGEDASNTIMTPLASARVSVGTEPVLASLSIPAPMADGGRVYGEVVHPFRGRSPIERVALSLRHASGLEQWVAPRPDGTFDFGLVEAGEYDLDARYRSASQAVGGVLVRRTKLSVSRGAERDALRIELPRSVPLIVRATTEWGDDLPDATIAAQVTPIGPAEARAHTLATGAELWLPAATGVVFVEHPERHPALVQLSAGSLARTAKLAPLRHGRRLVTSSREPVRDAHFMLVRVGEVDLPAPAWRNVRSDSGGRIEVEGLPLEAVVLREVVRKPGGGPQLGRQGSADLAGEGNDVEWDLR